MDTKSLIKAKGLELFNAYGVLNITLREVAKQMDKSYGNITYHYKTKEQLITELYEDMLFELRAISGSILQSQQLFMSILEAPLHTFDLSMKYLFLFKDFIEIRRNYPLISKQMKLNNTKGKSRLRATLVQLQREGLLRNDMEQEDLDYLMELSGAMRTFFLINIEKEELHRKGLKKQYALYMNRLLFPYLSASGRKVYQDYVRKL